MKRRSFSLVEVVVVLALIALLSSTFLIGVGRLLRSQQFRTAAVEVEEWLTLAQECMLIYRFDVEVTFENKAEGVYFQLHGEPPCKRKFSPALEPFFKEPHLIKGLGKVTFWRPGEGQQEGGEIHLSFWTPGTRMSKGLLYLYESGGNEQQVILLPGYPSALHTKPYEEWSDEQEELREALYPTQVGES